MQQINIYIVRRERKAKKKLQQDMCRHFASYIVIITFISVIQRTEGSLEEYAATVDRKHVFSM